jgi:hypothetical protein
VTNGAANGATNGATISSLPAGVAAAS